MKLPKILTEFIVLEHPKWHFTASRFKAFLAGGGEGSMPPDPPSKRRLRRLRQYLSEKVIPI